MKKLLLLLFSTTCFLSAFSNPPAHGYDYSIVFTGWFKNDVISLKINNTSIFENYVLDNSNEKTAGNLSLTQSAKGITIYYNNQEKLVSQLDVEFFLDVTITINKEARHFKVDLRKGRIVLVNCPGASGTKELCIEQIEEPVVF
jgi:hypothetical protein